MAPFDEITDGLPAPRDDEPASLRQDIVDELSDHLGCALNRELHRGRDVTKARDNVIERFGNPARIAYRLWFDAMKEKIMSQRITLAAAIVVAVACLFVAGMAWQMSQQNRETNLAILDKLSALATQQEEHKSLDWNQVKIKLVTGDENGPPAVGFKGQLQSPEKSMPDLDEVSSADGLLDFGQVRYGRFNLSLKAPWGEAASSKEISVRPGKGYVETIVCPSPLRAGKIKIEIEWPEDLKSAKLQVLCIFKPQPRLIGNLWWNERPPWKNFLISDNGTQTNYISWNPNYNSLEEQRGFFGASNSAIAPEAAGRLSERKWMLLQVTLLAPSETASPKGAEEEIAKLSNRPLGGYGFRMRNQRGFTFDGPTYFTGLTEYGDTPPYKEFSHSPPGSAIEAPEYDLKPEEISHWKIPLPDALIAHVRKTLKKE